MDKIILFLADVATFIVNTIRPFVGIARFVVGIAGIIVFIVGGYQLMRDYKPSYLGNGKKE